jgi:hypothetical protein
MTVLAKAKSNLPGTEIVPVPIYHTIKMYRRNGGKIPRIFTLALYLNQGRKERGWYTFSSIRLTLPLLSYTANFLTVHTNKNFKKQNESL